MRRDIERVHDRYDVPINMNLIAQQNDVTAKSTELDGMALQLHTVPDGALEVRIDAPGHPPPRSYD